MTSLAAKLDRFDAYADQALDELLSFAASHREELIAVARARHITGHYVYGDRKMFEYDSGRLVKETIEELADGIVYTAQRLALDGESTE